jgi:hypothetical protein
LPWRGARAGHFAVFGAPLADNGGIWRIGNFAIPLPTPFRSEVGCPTDGLRLEITNVPLPASREKARVLYLRRQCAMGCTDTPHRHHANRR